MVITKCELFDRISPILKLKFKRLFLHFLFFRFKGDVKKFKMLWFFYIIIKSFHNFAPKLAKNTRRCKSEISDSILKILFEKINLIYLNMNN